MKYSLLLLALAMYACNPNNTNDPPQTEKQTESPDTASKKPVEEAPKVYANERFRDVTVQRIRDSIFVIQGQAQIFEAAFSWVVEDGHNELRAGYGMTDAGAPEWGNFRFSLSIKKENPNSTLHLILFESSPKDGSRQHELPVVLY